MRFKSPKRSISSVMHYSPVPRGTLNVLCARSSSSSHSFFFFYLSWLSSSTRQSSRRVSFQLPEDRAQDSDESTAHTFCRLISAIAPFIIIFYTIEISVNSTDACLLNMYIHYEHYVFRWILYFSLLTDCLEAVYVNGFYENTAFMEI